MNTKFFKYIIPALSLVFSVNFTSCLGDLDVTPIDPNLNVEFDQNANFAKIYAGLAITGNKGRLERCGIEYVQPSVHPNRSV